MGLRDKAGVLCVYFWVVVAGLLPHHAFADPGLATAASVSMMITKDEVPSRGPSVCTPRLYGPGFDCDDYAYAYCQAHGLENCFILGLHWPSPANQHDPKFSHAVPVVRRSLGGGLWEFCIEDPQGDGRSDGMAQVHCWISDSPNPEFNPAVLRGPICEFYHGWGYPCEGSYADWRLTVWDPSRDWCEFSGEPQWYECGSRLELTRVCSILRDNGGGDLACWLPYSLLSCEAYLGEGGGGPACNNDNSMAIRACLNDWGSVSSVQCINGQWTLENPVPACSLLKGKSCDPGGGTAVDCSDGDVRGFGPTVRTLSCVKCETRQSVIVEEAGYCWR